MKTAVMLLGLAACAPALAEERAAERVPVLVELFTSEGCSSCPPADAFLRKLHQEQPVKGVEAIVLSEHVDYWDRLGWTDPFSSAKWSKRQSWYSMRWPTRVYTPQMIVDGMEEMIGSDVRYAKATMRKAAKEPKGTVRVFAAVGEGGVGLRIQAMGLPQGSPAHVRVAIVEDGLETEVPRGENQGKTLRHDGVVRLMETVGETEAGAVSYEGTVSLALDPDLDRERLRAIVFLQDAGSRRVVAIGVARLTDAP